MMRETVLMLAQAVSGDVRLTTGGAVIMVTCIILVLGLMTFCMTRILREKNPEEHHHSPLDIDTHDLDT